MTRKGGKKLSTRRQGEESKREKKERGGDPGLGKKDTHDAKI